MGRTGPSIGRGSFARRGAVSRNSAPAPEETQPPAIESSDVVSRLPAPKRRAAGWDNLANEFGLPTPPPPVEPVNEPPSRVIRERVIDEEVVDEEIVSPRPPREEKARREERPRRDEQQRREERRERPRLRSGHGMRSGHDVRRDHGAKSGHGANAVGTIASRRADVAYHVRSSANVNRSNGPHLLRSKEFNWRKLSSRHRRPHQKSARAAAPP